MPSVKQAEGADERFTEKKAIGSVEKQAMDPVEEQVKGQAKGSDQGPSLEITKRLTKRLTEWLNKETDEESVGSDEEIATRSTVLPGVQPDGLAVPSEDPQDYSQMVWQPDTPDISLADSMTTTASLASSPGSPVSLVDVSAKMSSENPALQRVFRPAAEPAVEPADEPAVEPADEAAVELVVRRNDYVLPLVAYNWEQPVLPDNIAPHWLPYGNSEDRHPPTTFCSWCDDLLSDPKVFTCLAWGTILSLIGATAYVLNSIFKTSTT